MSILRVEGCPSYRLSFLPPLGSLPCGVPVLEKVPKQFYLWPSSKGLTHKIWRAGRGRAGSGWGWEWPFVSYA